jgi:hypothetical protein
MTHRANANQLLLGFAEVGPNKELWEYAALVTSLDDEILTLGQLYRDRADAENVFDELKNQWGWGGFTTQDLSRCRLLAGTVALVYNWWSLFARLADPERHREAITAGLCCYREEFRTPLGVRKSARNEPAVCGPRFMGI